MHSVTDAMGLFFRRWMGLIRVVIVAAALGLGFWGWCLADRPTTWEILLNDAFRTLQLLTFQFSRAANGLGPAPLSWQLSLARFLIPAIALFESYRLVLGAIRSPTRLAMLGLRRGHIVVVPGRGSTGWALLREVRASGLRAIAVAPDLRTEDRGKIEEQGLAVLAADPFLEATWHQARADRADLVVVSHGSDVENLNIAVTVADALSQRKQSNGPMLVTALENESLAEQVDAALDNAAHKSGLRYRRLSVPEEAARTIFLDPPLPTRKQDRDLPSHIIVLGLGPGARPVLRHALTLGQDAAAAGPRISVLAAEKDLTAEPLLQPDAIPGFVAELRGVSCDLSSGLPLSALETLLCEAPPPVLACVCLADDAAVTTGMAMARQAALQGWPDFSIAVHQQRKDRFLTLLARENSVQGHARLRPFGGLLPNGSLRRLQNERDDRLPRAVHAHYLQMLRRLNAASEIPVLWDELPENVRHANRASADHIAVKLAAIGCRIVPGDSPPFAFTALERDALARIEHRRWSAERLLRGWRLGERDNEKRLHPDLIPFDDLTDEGQEKDRDAVSMSPEVLALAGLSIRRGPAIEPCAPA
jgi:voltage-gated potassium channel Kch